MKLLNSITNLFFPPICLGCRGSLSTNETSICVACRHNLPLTNFHLNNSDDVKNVFYGRIEIANATSLLRFHKKGIVQELIHSLKYRGHEEIGLFFGEWLGEELKNIKSYQNIDLVVPVPLHKKKLKQRGYNQVEKFGKAIAKALEVSYVDDVLLKINSTNTQVFKNRASRWQDNEVFTIQNEEKLNGKHILLVDDIITTGATIEACANALTKTHNNTLSIATMAIA